MTTKKEVALQGATMLALLLIARKAEKILDLKRFISSTLVGLFLYRMGAASTAKGTVAVPGRIPWLGHLILVQSFRNRTHESFLEISRVCNFQSYSGSFPFGLELVVLHDERDREYILKKNFDNYRKNFDFQYGFDKVFNDVLGSGIFAVDGKEWSTHRKIAANLFTEKNIGVIMSETFVEHAEMMKSALTRFAEEKKSFDIQLLFQALIFDAFCSIAFGVSPHSFNLALNGEKEPFQVSFDSAQQIASDRMYDPAVIRELKKFFSIGKEADMVKHMKVINDYIENIIESRKQDIREVTEDQDDKTHKDILGLYIYHARKQGRPELLETAYLRDVIVNFMIAGRDTTSYVLTNIISLVSENRDFEDKLVAGISEKMKRGIHNFLRNEIKDFPLADAVFNEALRMYPSVGNDSRFAFEDDTLPSGIEVRAGTVVNLANHSYGRNPEYWEKPEEFIPERWLHEVEHAGKNKTACKRINEFKFPFFWGGYRLCLGKDMARHEGKLMMCMLLNSFKFKYAQPKKDSFVNGPVMFYTEGVHLFVEARN